MNVNIKRLRDTALLPKYSKEGDAGLDLYANSLEFNTGMITIGTGLAIEIPEGYVGLLFPRSSVSNTSNRLANSVGVIDSNYRGEVKIKFDSIDNMRPSYNIGDRVAQLIILPYPTIELKEVDKLSLTNRGEDGFGSSGA